MYLCVDPEKLGLKDYFKIIKKPMDLSTIKAKLKDYNNYNEFAYDVRLTFHNCLTYNIDCPENYEIREMAKALLTQFNEQFNKFVRLYKSTK